MKLKLTASDKAIREYFQDFRGRGLCASRDIDDNLINLCAETWKYSVRRNPQHEFSAYIIPASKTDLSWDSAWRAYNNTDDLAKDPMRKEFANYMLKFIARRLKKPFVPIP